MRSFERERDSARYIPILTHATPHVALLRDGSVFSMFEVEGLCAQTLDVSALYRSREMLNHSLIGMTAHRGLVLYSWVCRGFADPSIYPGGEFNSTFGQQMDDRYRARLFDKSLFLNKTYVGVMLRPPAFAGEWVGEQLTKRTRSRVMVEEHPIERIQRLMQVCEIIGGDLAPYLPRRLGQRQVDRYSVPFSEIGEALAFAMTGIWRSVGVQTGQRIGKLLSERINIGKETIEIRGPGRSSWAACFGAQHMPQTAPPGTLDGFLSAPFRSTVAQMWRPIATQDALSFMGNKQHRMVSAGDRAHSQIASLNKAMDMVQSGLMAMGDHGLVVTTFADNIEDLQEISTSAWHILQDAGAQVTREDWAVEAAYFSMLPGNAYLRPRPNVISSWNYASLSSMHAFPSGDRQGQWGEALALLRTTGGTPFWFHLHVNQVANCFLFGESGSGKSAYLAFLIAQSERLGVQIVAWDKDRGLEIAIRAVGGSYLTLRNPTGIAPLKALTDNDQDIQHLAQLVRGLILLNAPKNFSMTEEEDRRLFVGLRGIMALPAEDRWLGDLRAFLGTSTSGAGARLEKWCRAYNGEYAWVVDNARDQIDISARVLGFDVTTFLDDPMVCGPVMTHLLYRTGKLADGRRLLYIVDEGWKVVDIPAFSGAAMDELKTDRKKNAGFIFATQSIRDALDSAIGHTIREQCKTVIAFAVERPDRADFRELRYSEREMEIIEGLRPGIGLHLIRQGKRSVVAQLQLGGMPEILAVLSGNSLNVAILDDVRERVGDDPERLIEEFQKCIA